MKYLWSIKVGCDDALPLMAKDAWTRYHDEVPFIASICVARRITVEDANYELHGLCDSSESAYAAAAYLLTSTANGQIQVHLLMGKSKVSPEKKLSISRLELPTVQKKFCWKLDLGHILNFSYKYCMVFN